jgi:hypothetical protein
MIGKVIERGSVSLPGFDGSHRRPFFVPPEELGELAGLWHERTNTPVKALVRANYGHLLINVSRRSERSPAAESESALDGEA